METGKNGSLAKTTVQKTTTDSVDTAKAPYSSNIGINHLKMLVQQEDIWNGEERSLTNPVCKKQIQNWA